MIEIVHRTAPEPVKPQIPTPEPSNEPPPTPEQLKDLAKSAVSALWGEDTRPAVRPAAPPAAIAPAEPPVVVEPAPAPAPTRPAPAPAPEPAPAPRPVSVSLEDTIQRTARVAADAVADRLAPPSPAPSDGPELTADDARDLKILRYMAANDPKMADMPEKFIAFSKKAYAYQDDWLEKNPDETFDWDNAEHTKWYEANAPAIDRAAMDEAKVEMRAEELWEKRMQPMIQKQQAEKAFERAAPVIKSRVEQAVVTMVDAVDPALGKLLRDSGGRPDLSNEAVGKVDETDPVACDILKTAAAELVAIRTELEKVDELDGYQINPHRHDPNDPNDADRRWAHAAILRYSNATENEILNGPAEEQIINGKQFTSIADMQRMKRQIYDGPGTDAQKQQKLDDLKATRICLQASDLKEIIQSDITDRAKREIARRDTLAKKKYVKNGNGKPAADPNVRQPEPEPQPAPQPEPAARPTEPARPPSLSSGSDMLTGGKPDAGPAKSFGEGAVAVLWK